MYFIKHSVNLQGEVFNFVFVVNHLQLFANGNIGRS